MVHTEEDKANNIIVILPEGKLVKADFETLSEQVNRYINDHDIIPSLLIQPKGLPHWDSFSAFISHMKLIKSHHKVIPKIAVVSDNEALSIMPNLANHFVKAKLRHFSNDNISAAKEWLKSVDDHPGSFEILKGLPSNVLGVEAKGIITAQDYEDTLVPIITQKLRKHDHLNILFVAGDHFQACSAGAIWDDTKFGMMHLTSFKRIAIVTDVGWLHHGAKFFGPLVPGKLHVFDLDQLDDAKEWVTH